MFNISETVTLTLLIYKTTEHKFFAFIRFLIRLQESLFRILDYSYIPTAVHWLTLNTRLHCLHPQTAWASSDTGRSKSRILMVGLCFDTQKPCLDRQWCGKPVGHMQPINEAGFTSGAPSLTPNNCNQIFPSSLTSLCCRSLWTALCLSACCVSSVNLVKCFCFSIVAVSCFSTFSSLSLQPILPRRWKGVKGPNGKLCPRAPNCSVTPLW